jgi:hypothetical protein
MKKEVKLWQYNIRGLNDVLFIDGCTSLVLIVDMNDCEL